MRHSNLQDLILKSGMHARYAFLLLNVAVDYAEMNCIADSIHYYRQAIEAFKQIGHHFGESIALSGMCVAEVRANRLREAASDCNRSETMARRLGDPKREARNNLAADEAHLAGGAETALLGESLHCAGKCDASCQNRRHKDQPRHCRC